MGKRRLKWQGATLPASPTLAHAQIFHCRLAKRPATSEAEAGGPHSALKFQASRCQESVQ